VTKIVSYRVEYKDGGRRYYVTELHELHRKLTQRFNDKLVETIVPMTMELEREVMYDQFVRLKTEFPAFLVVDDVVREYDPERYEKIKALNLSNVTVFGKRRGGPDDPDR
jgi:hypothetical protein